MILSCAPSVIWFRSTSWKSAIPGDLISQGSNEMNQPSAIKHKLSVIHKKKPTSNFLDAYDFLKVLFLRNKLKTRKVYVRFHLREIRPPEHGPKIVH